jgi:hypothetical protein
VTRKNQSESGNLWGDNEGAVGWNTGTKAADNGTFEWRDNAGAVECNKGPEAAEKSLEYMQVQQADNTPKKIQ